MNKIEEIFKAWQISYNPTSLQGELAIKRMEICDTCDSKKSGKLMSMDTLYYCVHLKVTLPSLL